MKIVLDTTVLVKSCDYLHVFLELYYWAAIQTKPLRTRNRVVWNRRVCHESAIDRLGNFFAPDTQLFLVFVRDGKLLGKRTLLGRKIRLLAD